MSRTCTLCGCAIPPTATPYVEPGVVMCEQCCRNGGVPVIHASRKHAPTSSDPPRERRPSDVDTKRTEIGGAPSGSPLREDQSPQEHRSKTENGDGFPWWLFLVVMWAHGYYHASNEYPKTLTDPGIWNALARFFTGAAILACNIVRAVAGCFLSPDILFLIVGVAMILAGAKMKDASNQRTGGGIAVLTIGIVLLALGTLMLCWGFLVGYAGATGL